MQNLKYYERYNSGLTMMTILHKVYAENYNRMTTMTLEIKMSFFGRRIFYNFICNFEFL